MKQFMTTVTLAILALLAVAVISIGQQDIANRRITSEEQRMDALITRVWGLEARAMNEEALAERRTK